LGADCCSLVLVQAIIPESLMFQLPPPPPAEVRLVQVMPVCGTRTYGSGEIVTPSSVPYQLGCSAPTSSGGYVRLKPSFLPGGTIRVEPDSFVMPNYGSN
jgi:hypothetical protein